jgi:hypothetical protein
MSLKYEKPKGQRFKRYFLHVQVKDPAMWWDCTNRIWVRDPDLSRGDFSNSAPCRTVRAFRRMLRKNPCIKKQAWLVNRYIGFDVWT